MDSLIPDQPDTAHWINRSMVKAALNLWHNEVKLTLHPLTTLAPVVERYQQHGSRASMTGLGKALREFLEEVLAGLKPDKPQLNYQDPSWWPYIVLLELYKHQQPRDRVAATLDISASRVDQVLADAVDAIVELLRRLPRSWSPTTLHQLRRPTADFVGRSEEIARLTAAMAPHSTEGVVVTITGIQGLGGIGKTELAYTLANHLITSFPDAQVVLPLGGTSEHPLTAEAALQAVIRALTPQQHLPERLQELTALYLSLLGSRRVLILADDAADAEQIRQLIPPTGSALIVTSRQHVLLPGMHQVVLGVLSPKEAQRLLLTICPRIATKAPRLAFLCGYLPLALRVTASLLASDPTLSVTTYLRDLEDERLRLQRLHYPDDATLNVEASLNLSYRALSPALQTTLCQISIFPTSFDRVAAAAVVQETEPPATESRVELTSVESRLGDLHRRSLVEWNDARERYNLHDLVRLFGRARLSSEETWATQRRHAGYYAQIAVHAGQLYLQGNAQVRAALQLFDDEWPHIEAGWHWVVNQVQATTSADIEPLLLDYATGTAYIGALRYTARKQRIQQFEVALDIARKWDDPAAVVAVLNRLAGAILREDTPSRAIPFLEEALALAETMQDDHGALLTRTRLGWAYRLLNQQSTAIDHFTIGLALARRVGSRRDEGALLNHLGNSHADSGRYRESLTYLEQALEISREVGDRLGQSYALNNLGLTLRDLGEIPRALQCFHQDIAITRELGDRSGESTSHYNLSLAYWIQGHPEEALSAAEEALFIAREVAHERSEGCALDAVMRIHTALGQPQHALEMHDAAYALAQAVEDISAEAEVFHGTCDALGALGKFDEAIAEGNRALAIAQQIEDPGLECDVLATLSHIVAAQGNTIEAIRLAQRGLGIAEQIQRRWCEAQLCKELALLCARQGDQQNARSFMERCLAIETIMQHAHLEADRHMLDRTA